MTVTTVGGTSATSAADQFTYVAAPTVTGINPSSGPSPPATLVTITGTGFNGATAVDFGTIPATDVTVVSDTSITADSPAGTGAVDVTVTTVGGTSPTSPADQFTYVAVPTVTGVNPSSGPESAGTWSRSPAPVSMARPQSTSAPYQRPTLLSSATPRSPPTARPAPAPSM